MSTDKSDAMWHSRLPATGRIDALQGCHASPPSSSGCRHAGGSTPRVLPCRPQQSRPQTCSCRLDVSSCVLASAAASRRASVASHSRRCAALSSRTRAAPAANAGSGSAGRLESRRASSSAPRCAANGAPASMPTSSMAAVVQVVLWGVGLLGGGRVQGEGGRERRQAATATGEVVRLQGAIADRDR